MKSDWEPVVVFKTHLIWLLSLVSMCALWTDDLVLNFAYDLGEGRKKGNVFIHLLFSFYNTVPSMCC